MTSIFRLGLALLACALFSVQLQAAPAPQMTQQDVDVWLDGLMPATLKAHDVAGAVVVVVKDGKVLTQRGYGYADVAKRIPVDPQGTLFRPGSISKLFTWTAVMQLVEQGKIDLDADINRYLDFKIDGRGGKPITMRNIMTHRAGFEEFANHILTLDPARLETTEQMLKAFVPKRIFDPGEVPAYSNYATTVAGYIVQRVSGLPFDDYVEKNIFRPLSMTNSTFRQPLPTRMLPMMSKGYMAGSEPARPFEFVLVAPAGSLSATGADLGRFMIAHLNQGQFDGKSILRPETVSLMHDSAIETAPGLNRMLLGFYETNMNGHRVISHGGDTNSFYSYLHLFVNDDVGIYVSFNSSGSPNARTSPRDILFKGFTNRYFPDTSRPPRYSGTNAARDAQLISGHYLISRRPESSFLSFANVFLTGTIKPTNNGGVEVNFGETERFRHVGPMLWVRERDGEILGAKVVDGKVTQAALNSFAAIMVGQPVPMWRSGAIMIPAFALSALLIVMLALSWPVGALTRRYYGISFSKTGRAALLHNAARGLAVAIIVMFIVWFVLTDRASSYGYIPSLAITGSGVLTFLFSLLFVVVNAWQLKLSLTDKAGIVRIATHALMVIISLFLMWLFWAGGLFAISANY
jgi:CubicO group peptidase (beta-lactamase class C family)